MKKKALAIIFIMFFVSFGYCETDEDNSIVIGYEIILKDGRSIETKMCWEEGEKVFYQKYGSTIGLYKSKVEEVKKIKAISDAEAIQYQGGDNIEENYSRNANLGCTKAFCPDKGICFGEKIHSPGSAERTIRWAKEKIAECEKAYKKRRCIEMRGPDPYFCDKYKAQIKYAKRGLVCAKQLEYEPPDAGRYRLKKNRFYTKSVLINY